MLTLMLCNALLRQCKGNLDVHRSCTLCTVDLANAAPTYGKIYMMYTLHQYGKTYMMYIYYVGCETLQKYVNKAGQAASVNKQLQIDHTPAKAFA